MKQVKLRNPQMSDFSVPMDANNNGIPVLFTIHAGEIESFDEPVAIHIKDHLAKRIAQETRGNGTYEDAYEKAVKEIEDVEWKQQ